MRADVGTTGEDATGINKLTVADGTTATTTTITVTDPVTSDTSTMTITGNADLLLNDSDPEGGNFFIVTVRATATPMKTAIVSCSRRDGGGGDRGDWQQRRRVHHQRQWRLDF